MTTRIRIARKATPSRMRMAIPALIMGLLFPVIGVTAIFLLLRGHDLPGGGFVAGITMAVAFILQYMARGTIWVEARLQVLARALDGHRPPSGGRHRRRRVAVLRVRS